MHFVQLATKKYCSSIISLSSSMGWACFLSYLYLLAFTVNVTAYCLREIQIFLIIPQRFLWSSRVNISEKAMAPHSGPLAWNIPWMGEPGRLQSMGWRRVGHDWATSLSLFTFTWRRKWQPTPVFLLGESQGPGSMVGCRLWSHTELDTAETT